MVIDGEKELCTSYSLLNSFNGYGLVFDSSVKINNYSIVHFYKRLFRVVESNIDGIDIDFIKIIEPD